MDDISQLQNLSRQIHEILPYDNFSDCYERAIVAGDLAGGNCVFLGRLLAATVGNNPPLPNCSVSLDIDDLKLYVAKKYSVGIVETAPVNHVIAMYKNKYLIELAGSDSTVLTCGQEYSKGSYSTRPAYDVDSGTVSVYKTKTGTEQNLLVIQFSVDNIYKMDAQIVDVMKSTIKTASYARYLYRYPTGEHYVQLKAETDKENHTYFLSCGTGSLNKKGKHSYTDLTKHTLMYPDEFWKKDAAEFLEKMLSLYIQENKVDITLILTSLENWLKNH